MELLGAYASDDDETSGATAAVPSSNSQPVHGDGGAHGSSTASRSRRRQLDMSILPQHIQDLLTGKGGDDSDSEDEQRLVKGTRQSEGTSRSEAQGLLELLPRPSHAGNREFSLKVVSRPPNDSSNIFSRMPEPSVEFTFHQGSSSTSSYEPEPGIYSAVSVAEESVLPSIQSLPRKSAAPTVHREEMGAGPTAQASSVVEREFTRGGESARKRSRREEREIERSLLTGDMSRLEGASFIEVQGKQPWDSTAYDERRQKEAEVLSVYNFGGKGGEKAIMQPTKVQNKRHHINSLAMHAAETELALLDARGQRSKTKAETMAKYGW